MDSLFKRAAETLDGYTPKFNREFMRFNLQVDSVQVGGGLGSMDDEITHKTRYTIQVCGARLQSTAKFYGQSNRDIIASLCNEFLANPANQTMEPKAWQFLTSNAIDLNNSNRYWHAVEHLEKVEKVREEIRELQDQVARAEIIASVNAVEVKEQRTLTQKERDLLLAEFSGGEFYNRRDQ